LTLFQEQIGDNLVLRVHPIEGRKLTVEAFLEFLEKNELDKYIYDPTGSGCRWWCTVVIREAERLGLVDVGSLKSLLDFVAERHQESPERVPLPIRRGVFYGPSNEDLLNSLQL